MFRPSSCCLRSLCRRPDRQPPFHPDTASLQPPSASGDPLYYTQIQINKNEKRKKKNGIRVSTNNHVKGIITREEKGGCGGIYSGQSQSNGLPHR